MLARALLLLPVIAVGLRLAGYKRVQAALDALGRRHSTSPPPNGDEAMSLAVRSTRMVVLAARRGAYRANCLPTSMALRHLLQRQGIAGTLRVGVRKNGPALDAHAWVELDGQPLNDSADVQQRFLAFSEPLSYRAKAGK